MTEGTAGSHTIATGRGGAGEADPALRPVLVTFGSVSEPDGGVQVRSRVIAEILTDLGAAPVVVSTREPLLSPLQPPWASRLRVPKRKPIKAFSPGFVRLIRQESVAGTVLIITNAMFIPAVALSRSRAPLIWDTNECQTLHYRRLPPTWANRGKYVVWMVLERWAAKRCQVAVAIGAAEATTWPSIHPKLGKKVAVVDHAAFWQAPAAEPRRALEQRIGTALPGPVLLFLGTLLAKHNAAAAAWILETLVATLPEGATVVLCGPGTQLLALPDPGPVRVVALGEAEDVDTVVAAADLCLAPLASGAGVKTKVLHYLAHGKPVAGTPAAFEGLDGAPGLYAETLERLPALIGQRCRQTEDPADADARAVAQRTWLEEHHGRAHIAAQWQEVFRCLASSAE